MCTVTLRCSGGSLLLTMNRDERWDRAPEQAPRFIPGEPGRPGWIAPFDSASGGTWIGVNDRGVGACVLNGYAPADDALRDDPSVPSRGSIIPRILEEQGGDGPARVPANLDFSAYPSFVLLVASPHGGEIVRWEHGGALTRERVGTGWSFLTSSSWKEPDVTAWRRRAFESWLEAGAPTVYEMPSWHLLAPTGEEAMAPFMTRPNAATRSITAVRVAAERGSARLIWWPRVTSDPIDAARPGGAIEMALVAPQAGAA
jgi:transport and Golgi organization protein 2